MSTTMLWIDSDGPNKWQAPQADTQKLINCNLHILKKNTNARIRQKNNRFLSAATVEIYSQNTANFKQNFLVQKEPFAL